MQPQGHSRHSLELSLSPLHHRTPPRTPPNARLAHLPPAAMSSSESDDDSTIFAGLTFFIHGHWAGRTYGRVAREIKENGGRVVKDVTDIDLSHAVVSGQLWSKQGTVGADHTIRAIIAANEGNRSEEDEDQNVRLLLPLDPVLLSCLDPTWR